MISAKLEVSWPKVITQPTTSRPTSVHIYWQTIFCQFIFWIWTSFCWIYLLFAIVLWPKEITQPTTSRPTSVHTFCQFRLGIWVSFYLHLSFIRGQPTNQDAYILSNQIRYLNFFFATVYIIPAVSRLAGLYSVNLFRFFDRICICAPFCHLYKCLCTELMDRWSGCRMTHTCKHSQPTCPTPIINSKMRH